ncbi:septal ring lytic transglycosylase RlpA family protein [Clostridium cylindrosporum]|uniref:RlpA-like protein double-psi beta-barrel domain-containing protein n=1 Tax=Clostridium cylindrosporum DSM 605 TaxID=1121307 RepID=A0A0J8D8Z7_CLOCY|nr:septal ring lytic transglycosylase RlpA family protein [Clostridium cylindrosporum]KMT22352.1 hypothetical protein CLCY_19c00030 [Clostridium cylindrosporum DSM 605]
MKKIKKLLCITTLICLVQSNVAFASEIGSSHSDNVLSYMDYGTINDEDIILTAASTTTSTTTAATVKAKNKQSGLISWFDIWKEKTTASGKKAVNGAAHKTIKLRTQVSVTNNSNSKKASVVILDRGPYASGRILDMSKESFSKVESLKKGLFKGTIIW